MASCSVTDHVRGIVAIALVVVLGSVLVGCGQSEPPIPVQESSSDAESIDSVPYAPPPMGPDDAVPILEVRALDEVEFQAWWYDVNGRWGSLAGDLVEFMERELADRHMKSGDEARASEFALLVSQVSMLREEAISIDPPERFVDGHEHLVVYFEEMTLGWEGMLEALRSDEPGDFDAAWSRILAGERSSAEAWRDFEAAGGAKP